LVTGVSGFAGGAIGRYLRENIGHRVVGLSRSAPRPGSCDDFIAHDLALPLPEDVPQVDYIVHCAALSSPWAAPADYHRNSVLPVRWLADLTRRRPVRRLVFLSSSAVHYRLADQTGLTEESTLADPPINAYAQTKQEGEAILAGLDVPVTVLRPRALFGPGDTVVFPRILHAARKGVLPVLVRPDGGMAQSDLLYIGTLAAYVARVLEGDVSGTFLLTNAAPVGTYDLLNTVFSALGIPHPSRRVPIGLAMLVARGYEWHSRVLAGWREPPVTRFGVASLGFHKTFDVSKALATLGPPEVAMSDGVDRFIDWQRTQAA
jgi:nucleoside-diphosphate-sugar epimerase